MEVNKIIEIIEDNFRLSSDDYIKLMGVVQELQQHRLRRDGNNGEGGIMDVLERIENQVNNLVKMVGGQTSKIEKVHVDFADLVDLVLLAKISKQTQWVSVAERLPAKDDTILAWIGTTCVKACVGKTPYGPAWYLVDNNSYLNWWHVTHWMPLPEPPKGVEWT